MFKLVVLSTLLALAAAKPGYLHGSYALPSAISTSNRVDIHGPSIAVHAGHGHLGAPVLLDHGHGGQALYSHIPSLNVAHGLIPLPSAYSHQSRIDVHHPGHQLVHTVHNVPTLQVVHAPALHGVSAVHGGYGHY